MLVCMPVLIDSLWLPGPTLPVPVKGHRVSYGCLVKGMSGWQRQRDHGKCDTRVPLTGRDGRCWQLACQPPLGAWQADRRSAALPLWGNKLHLLKLNARHKRTYRWKHLSWLGGRKGGGGSFDEEKDELARAGCFFLDSLNTLTERWISGVMVAGTVRLGRPIEPVRMGRRGRGSAAVIGMGQQSQ